MKQLMQLKEDIEIKVDSASMGISFKPANIMTAPVGEKVLFPLETCHICGDIPMTTAWKCVLCTRVFCFRCTKGMPTCKTCKTNSGLSSHMNRNLIELSYRYSFLHSCEPLEPKPSLTALNGDEEEEVETSEKDDGKSGEEHEPGKNGSKSKERDPKQSKKVYTFQQLMRHLREECPTSRRAFICPNKCIREENSGEFLYTAYAPLLQVPGAKDELQLRATELTSYKVKKHTISQCLRLIKAHQASVLDRLRKR